MLHFIEGRSGCGKTAYLYRMLTEKAKRGEKKLIFLTPEQRSFECEKELLHILGAPLAGSVKVMSFRRLYDLVMTETGGVRGTPIDDGAQKIIMAYTLEDCADQLDLYANQAKKPAFIEVALNAIREFKQCGIEPEAVRAAAAGVRDDFQKKLTELALIYELYNANVSLSGVDPCDNDMRLEIRAAETDFFRGYTIAADDFSGFTAQQHKIIRLMMAQADEFYISLCLDPYKEDDLFFTVMRTKKRIMKAAAKLGLKIASPERLTENFRTKSRTLSCVEENILRRRDAEISEIPKDELAHDLTVVQAADVYEECAYIAAKISDMALSGECRWRDIAVVFRNSERYAGVLDAALDKSGVPYFMSKPQPVEGKPLMRLATAALEFAVSPSDQRKIFAALKSDLLGISGIRAAQLENYAYVWGLKGRAFREPFTANPNGFTDRFTENDARALAQINETRLAVMTPLLNLCAALESDDGRLTAKQIGTALYSYMLECGVPELLRKRAADSGDRIFSGAFGSDISDNENTADITPSAFDSSLSGEELRLWDVFIGVLGKMNAALSDRRITLRRFCELFRLVIKDEDISDIPQTLDRVLVGKADSMRFSKPYCVFVTGAADGEFPHMPVSDGVFSDAERKSLIASGMELYDAVSELYMQEKFFVYNAVSAPCSRLFVSYPKGDLTGGACSPSVMIEDIFRIFPKLPLTFASSLSDIERVSSERTALELYARRRITGSPISAALSDILSQSTGYADKIKDLGAPIKNIDMRIKNESVCEMIFGRDKRLSASQIEKFYQCRFMYFCNYGIRLRDRKKAELDNLVYGTLLHYTLENVIRAYIDRDYAPFSDKELEELLDEIITKYIKENLGGEGGKTERFMHLYKRSRARMRRVIDHMMEELAQSHFKPVDAELDIGREGGLPEYTVEAKNGSKVAINGQIDRVDIMDEFVRVIDYKTSGKELDLAEAMNGINMQMLIYLAALSKDGHTRYHKVLTPAAVLYMRSDIGSVRVDDVTGSEDELRSEVSKKLDDQLKMKGIILDEERVADGMGRDKKKLRYVSATSVTPKQLEMILDAVEDNIRRMSAELDGGVIPAVPTSSRARSGKHACKYCEFKAVCRREGTDTENVIFKQDSKKTLEKLERDHHKITSERSTENA